SVSLFTSGVVELLDVPQLRTQLLLLERRTRSGGRDTVDHPRGAHDDLCNSALGALRLASKLACSGRSVDGPARGRHVSDYNPWDRAQKRDELPTHDSFGRRVRYDSSGRPI